VSAHTLVIVNPASGSGTAGRRIPELERLLAAHVVDFSLVRTQGPGHAEQLAREGALAGARRIAIAGGDGTVSEALSGLLPLALAQPPELGLLPLGSGRDFARGLGLGNDLAASVQRLARGRLRTVDAGRVVCCGPDGTERIRHFLNITSFGVSGESTLWVQQRGRRGRRGRASYLQSGVVGLLRYRSPQVAIAIDGRPAHRGRLMLAAVANGRYFGGGMHVAPHAQIDDGLFDVVIVDGMTKLQALACFSQLLRGRHLRRPDVRVLRGRQVEIEADAPIWLEADGEPLGTPPARLSLLPRALTLCGL